MTKIICLGDSLTYGYMIKEENKWVNIINSSFEDFLILNRGINGDTTYDMLKRFKFDVLRETPDYVFIWGCGNDFFETYSVDFALKNLYDMYTLAEKNNIKPLLILTTPLDETKSLFDTSTALIRAMEEKIDALRDKFIKENLNFFDLNKIFKEKAINIKDELFLDEIHFNDRGSILVAEIMKEYIEKNIIIN